MKSKLLQLLIALSLLAVPLTAVHADSVTDGLNIISKPFPSTGLAKNPQNFVVQLIDILLYLSAILAVIFIIYGGYLYITSGGNEESATKGRKALMYALIGLVIVILSYLIVNITVSIVENGNISIGSGGGSGNGNNTNGPSCLPGQCP